jgi:LAO/AO transport system kinase
MGEIVDSELETRVAACDFRAVSRLITLLENNPARARGIIARLYSKGGKARVVGITGAPGAGKSTLVDVMCATWRAKGKKVGVLAIDPSSPFSGGAILGDRIRMTRASEDPDIFIRSMATRGVLGGLSAATIEAIAVLDCAGFDLIIVETVGVGQAEVDIMRAADTCVVVLVPGMGDGVQILKAGLIEIADLFVINKADYPTVHLLERDLLGLLALVEYASEDWKPPILRSVATKAEGVDLVCRSVERHGAWLGGSEIGKARRCRAIENMLTKVVGEEVRRRLGEGLAKLLETQVSRVYQREITPYEGVTVLLDALGLRSPP